MASYCNYLGTVAPGIRYIYLFSMHKDDGYMYNEDSLFCFLGLRYITRRKIQQTGPSLLTSRESKMMSMFSKFLLGLKGYIQDWWDISNQGTQSQTKESIVHNWDSQNSSFAALWIIRISYRKWQWRLNRWVNSRQIFWNFWFKSKI